MNLNKVFIIGRLAADPEVRNTQSGQRVTTIRVATNRTWKNQAGEKQEQVEFHSVVAWGRLADIIGQYMKRGNLIMIEGRLQTRSWTGQDNVKRYQTEIVAENMQMGPRANFQHSDNNLNETSKPEEVKSESKSSNSNNDNIPVINEDEPIINDDDIEEKEIDVKDIPF